MRVGAQILSLGRPFEGWRAASYGLGPLPRTRGSTLAHGRGREGSVAQPLPREGGRRVNRLAATRDKVWGTVWVGGKNLGL